MIGQWKFLYWEIIGGLNLWNSKLSATGLSKKILIVFFLSAILLVWPYSASSIYAVQPIDPNKDIGKPDTSSNQSTNNEKENQGKNYKKLLENYPDTTPMQEKIKQAIQVMKEGDPKKPKENNGKRNPQNIPELVTEVLSKEEIKKDGIVVGKKIKTKTTLIFSNRGQSLVSEKDWDKIGFNKNFISPDSAVFEEMCAKTNGKVTEDGQFCDVSDSLKNKLNSKLSELYQNWDLDDESFYIIEGDVDFEKVKNEAKKRFKDKPQLTRGNEKNLIQEDGNYFKTNSNPLGLDTKKHEKKIEFIEEYEVSYSDAYERSLEDSDGQSQIVPSSYSSESLQENSFWSNDWSGDFSSMILPEAHGDVIIKNEFAMMGFTLAPPSFHYSIEFTESFCFTLTYPTGLHVIWPNHWHIHTAKKRVCFELFYFKIFADAEIAAGLRLPVKLDLTGLPPVVFPNIPFNMTIGLEGKDFFKEDYVKFCENEWHTIKSDPILSLASLVGQSPCENFALQSSLTPEGSGTKLDGDEFAIKFIFKAGIEFKIIDRSFDVCSEIIERVTIFMCAYGVDIDLGRDITGNNISGSDPDIQIDLMFNTTDDNDFVRKLKELNLSASTFETPVGEGKPTAFKFGTTIPADCSEAVQINFPKADGNVTKKGPFKRQELENGDIKTCEEPSANCICTGFIILKREYEISDTPELKVKMALGISFAVGIELLGGKVLTDLNISGDVNSTSKVVLEYGKCISGCGDSRTATWKLDGIEIINVTAVDNDVNSDYIKVELSNFEYILNSFALTADPVIDLSGNIVDEITSLTGINPDITIPLLRFDVIGTGLEITIPQHARTGPVTFLIPVDYFGMIAPADLVFEAEGLQSLVPLGDPIFDPNQTVIFDINATNPQLFELGNHFVFYNATNLNTTQTRNFTQSIIVQDTTPPEFTFIPADIQMEAEGPLTFVSIENSTATDAVDPSPMITSNAPNNTEFQVGLGQIIVWEAKDFSDNVNKTKQVINVTDTTPPTMKIPADRTDGNSIGISGFNSLVDIGLASATDIADLHVAISIDELEGEREIFACESGFVADDGDGVQAADDNCPGVKNQDQKDTDGDGIGDVCDFDDVDGDGVFGTKPNPPSPNEIPIDNCVYVANPPVNGTQTDSDGDGFGDACDAGDDKKDNDRDGEFDEDDEKDSDHDGVPDVDDNCKLSVNPPVNGTQTDSDGDGLGDECDATPTSDGQPPKGDSSDLECVSGDNDLDGRLDEDREKDGTDEDKDGSDGEDPLETVKTLANATKSMLVDLSLGDHEVTWRATDDSGNFVLANQTVRITLIGDFNGNFIHDELEVGDPPSNSTFAKTGGNITSTGEIIEKGGLPVVVSQIIASDAILISTGLDGDGTAIIDVCEGLATLKLGNATQTAFVCGSVTVISLVGNTVVDFHVGENDATAVIPKQTGVTYDDFLFDLVYFDRLEFEGQGDVTVTYLGKDTILNNETTPFNLDMVSPVLTVEDQDLEADIPQGAFADYVFSVTDNLDPNPIVTCDPAEGTLLKLGFENTTTCVAKDTSNNTDEESFEVFVLVAKKTFDGFTQQVLDMELKKGNEKGILALIDEAANGFEADNINKSKNLLKALTKMVGAKSGKNIPTENADKIIEGANLIIKFYNNHLIQSSGLSVAEIASQDKNGQNGDMGKSEFGKGQVILPSSSTLSNTVITEDESNESLNNSTQTNSTSQDIIVDNSDVQINATSVDITKSEISPSDTQTTDIVTDDSEVLDSITVGRGIATDNDSDVLIDTASFFTVTNDNTPPAAQTADIVTDEDTGGGGDEYLTRPTFGVSHETFETIVDSGFRFNEQSFTINDNFHTPFAQQTVNIGEVNTFEAKIYADKRLKVQEFLFGIPNVGEAHLAELGVEIWYDYNGEIEDVKAVQKSNVIDKKTIVASHEKTKCQASDSEKKCDVTNVSMIFLEPLKDQIMAVKAIDYKGRYQITYLNEGVVIAGESLNPMQTYLIPSNVRDGGLIKVTHLAKYSPY